MKKLYSIFGMVLLAAAAFSLTSCDDDANIAYTLEGTWRGDMHVQMPYDGYDYNATYSELCFTQDPYTYSSGTGYWVDFYSRAPWDYVANHTQWTVRNGTIYIYLVEEGTSLQIRDYGLSDGYFYGTIYYGDITVDFDLTHISSPNWNDYRYGYSYWYDYYVKPALTDSLGGKSAAQPMRAPVRTFKKN